MQLRKNVVKYNRINGFFCFKVETKEDDILKNAFLKVMLIITIISSLFLCGLLFLLSQKGNTKEGIPSKLKEFQEKYDERANDTMTIAPNVYMDFSDMDDMETLYDPARHTEVYDRIEALKHSEEFSQNAPLLVYNPYGTDALSLYVYFKTELPMKASYRVSVQGGELATFSANCANELPYVTEHEYLFLGLARGVNRVSISLTDVEGNTSVRNFYVTVEKTAGQEREKLSPARGTGSGSLSDGLYAHFGNRIAGKSLVLFYDNEGALRGEIPLLSGDCHRLLFSEDLMYFNISDTQFAAMNRFGRVERVITLDGYTIGKDYCLDETGTRMYVLASKTGEDARKNGTNDRVLLLNLVTGEYSELLNMGTLLKEYKEVCSVNVEEVLEWLTLNSVQPIGENGLLLSAREPSAVIRVTDIDTVPALVYIIGDMVYFDGTGYEGELLTKNNEFESFFGINTVTIESTMDLRKGLYTFYLFDNHIGTCDSRPNLDLSEAAQGLGSSMKKGTSSYFCRFTVNETARTVEQTECTPLAYSGYEGSVQILPNGNLLSDCAGRFTYSEFNEKRELLCSFTVTGDDYLGRVFKYDFKDFYFADPAKLAVPAEEETGKKQ